MSLACSDILNLYVLCLNQQCLASMFESVCLNIIYLKLVANGWCTCRLVQGGKALRALEKRVECTASSPKVCTM